MTSSTGDGGIEPPDWPDPDPDHELTWRQQNILHFIRDYSHRRGYMPALREIADAAELASTSSVSNQLAELQRKGYLWRTPGRSRSIELRLPGQPPVRLETRTRRMRWTSRRKIRPVFRFPSTARSPPGRKT